MTEYIDEIFWSTVLIYVGIIVMSFYTHNDYKSGFQDDSGKYTSTFCKWFYRLSATGYVLMMIVYGYILYLINTLFKSQGYL